MPRARPMSPRARGYLLIAGSRHALTAALCLVGGSIFASAGFDQIRAVLPIWAWGWGFVTVATASAAAAGLGNRPLARAGLTLSAVASVVWGIGFLFAAGVSAKHGEPPAGLLGGSWCLHMAAKDLVVSANPMRTPMEDLAQRVAAEDA